MADRTYHPSALEQALYTWARAVLNAYGFSTVPVIFANQGHLMQPSPFVTLNVTSDTLVSDPETIVNDDGSVSTLEHRTGTCSLSCYGSNAYDVASAIRRSITDPRIADTLNDAEISIQRVAAIINAPLELGTITEQRRIIDVTFAFSEEFRTAAEAVQVVESVVANGDIYRQNAGDGITTQTTVDWP